MGRVNVVNWQGSPLERDHLRRLADLRGLSVVALVRGWADRESRSLGLGSFPEARDPGRPKKELNTEVDDVRRDDVPDQPVRGLAPRVGVDEVEPAPPQALPTRNARKPRQGPQAEPVSADLEYAVLSLYLALKVALRPERSKAVSDARAKGEGVPGFARYAAALDAMRAKGMGRARLDTVAIPADLIAALDAWMKENG